MAGKVFITGANGRLGASVQERIGAIPLVRKPSGLKGEIVTDFSENQLKVILKDASVIVHIAGSVDTLDKKRMEEGNVLLTNAIVESAPKGCRVIFAGSISVYGKELKGKPADEETPVSPDSAYARTKYQAERLVAKMKDHVIFRIGTIYGPRFEDYFRVLSQIEKGKMSLIGKGDNRIPFVHVDDVAKAFEAAVSKGQGVYVLAGEPLTQKEIFDIAAGELGVEAPKKSMDRGIAMFIAALMGSWGRVRGKKPKLTQEHISVLSYDRVFDCRKAKADLGFAPRPLGEGIRDIVKAYKKRG
ncbi:MAG: NAD-dependent epimerase/dehydratase family protein [Candidatus Micrarchaeota archaeon]